MSPAAVDCISTVNASTCMQATKVYAIAKSLNKKYFQKFQKLQVIQFD